MTEHDDALAALRAKVDQAVAESEEVARGVAGYFNSLLAHGLTRDEALFLARDWQRSVFGCADDD